MPLQFSCVPLRSTSENCAVLPCFSDFGCFPTAHFLTFPGSCGKTSYKWILRCFAVYVRTGGLAGMIFPVVLCTYVRSIYPPFSLVIGNSGFQSRPVFGHRKSMVMKTAKFLTAGRNHFAKSCFSKPCTLFTEQWVFSLFQTKPHGTIKWDICLYGQSIAPAKIKRFWSCRIFHCSVHPLRFGE